MKKKKKIFFFSFWVFRSTDEQRGLETKWGGKEKNGKKEEKVTYTHALSARALAHHTHTHTQRLTHHRP